MNEQEKQSQEALDAKLDKIIDPLFTHILSNFVMFSNGEIEQDILEATVKDILAVAVLEGARLAELVNERLDEQLVEQVEKQQGNDFASRIMCPNSKARDASIALNMNDKSGQFNRYVLPEDVKDD